VSETKQVLDDALTPLERFAFNAPTILKKLLLFILNHQPLLKKKHMGTIGVTSVGMKGTLPGWIVPLGGTTTILFAISGMQKKPGVHNDQVMIRDYVNITISVDHDIIDGGPLARFMEDFLKLCEQAYGLKEQEKTMNTADVHQQNMTHQSSY
jgi:hypothetical protein